MKRALLVVLVLLLTGCASIVSKTTYPVEVNSVPEAVSFEVKRPSGELICNGVTPQTVDLKSGAGYFRAGEYVVTFKKEGYEDQTYFLSGELDGWYVGNILIGGLIGFLIIDPATGAMWSLPESIISEFPVAAELASDGEVTVLSVDEVPEEIKNQMIPVE